MTKMRPLDPSLARQAGWDSWQSGFINPANDSAMIAATLKDADFDVVDSRHDLPAVETRRAPRDFADRTCDAGIAVVDYVAIAERARSCHLEYRTTASMFRFAADRRLQMCKSKSEAALWLWQSRSTLKSHSRRC